MPGPEAVVVVVAFGADDLLEQALAPVVHEFRVVVVDNASRAECREICRRLGAEYLDPGHNLGFAGGVNVALTQLPVGSDVVLLNPDAQVEPTALRRLVGHLGGADRIACAAPRQLHPSSGRAERVSWPFPSPGGKWLEAVGLGRLDHRSGFLIGSVLAVSGDALADVGPFDERFFLYCEETDWQRRARDRGWSVLLVDDVLAHHVGAGTSTISERREAYFHAAQELYVRKWFGPRGWASYRLACLVGDVVRALTGGQRARDARQRLAVYRRGPVRHRDDLLARVAQ